MLEYIVNSLNSLTDWNSDVREKKDSCCMLVVNPMFAEIYAPVSFLKSSVEKDYYG